MFERPPRGNGSYSFIHSFNPYSVLRKVPSLFQSKNFTECDLVFPVSIYSIPSFPEGRGVKLWHACQHWHAAFPSVPIFFYFFCPTSVSILWRMCVCVYTSECVGIAYGLLLLPNNTASEAFLHIGTVWGVDWIFIIGAPIWWWLGEYVTLGTTS